MSTYKVRKGYVFYYKGKNYVEGEIVPSTEISGQNWKVEEIESKKEDKKEDKKDIKKDVVTDRAIKASNTK